MFWGSKYLLRKRLDIWGKATQPPQTTLEISRIRRLLGEISSEFYAGCSDCFGVKQILEEVKQTLLWGTIVISFRYGYKVYKFTLV